MGHGGGKLGREMVPEREASWLEAPGSLWIS